MLDGRQCLLAAHSVLERTKAQSREEAKRSSLPNLEVRRLDGERDQTSLDLPRVLRNLCVQVCDASFLFPIKIQNLSDTCTVFYDFFFNLARR